MDTDQDLQAAIDAYRAACEAAKDANHRWSEARALVSELSAAAFEADKLKDAAAYALLGAVRTKKA